MYVKRHALIQTMQIKTARDASFLLINQTLKSTICVHNKSKMQPHDTHNTHVHTHMRARSPYHVKCRCRWSWPDGSEASQVTATPSRRQTPTATYLPAAAAPRVSRGAACPMRGALARRHVLAAPSGEPVCDEV